MLFTLRKMDIKYLTKFICNCSVLNQRKSTRAPKMHEGFGSRLSKERTWKAITWDVIPTHLSSLKTKYLSWYDKTIFHICELGLQRRGFNKYSVMCVLWSPSLGGLCVFLHLSLQKTDSDSGTTAGQAKQEPNFLVRSRRAAVWMAYVPTSLVLCTLISEVALSKSLNNLERISCTPQCVMSQLWNLTYAVCHIYLSGSFC